MSTQGIASATRHCMPPLLAVRVRARGTHPRKRPLSSAWSKRGPNQMLSINVGWRRSSEPYGLVAPQPSGLCSNTVPIPYSRIRVAPRQCFLRSRTLAEAAPARPRPSRSNKRYCGCWNSVPPSCHGPNSVSFASRAGAAGMYSRIRTLAANGFE